MSMQSIAIVGAGDIGCAVGIALGTASLVNPDERLNVVFVGRDTQTSTSLRLAAARGGAQLVHEKSGWSTTRLSADICKTAFTCEMEKIRTAGLIFLACKRHHNAAVVPQLCSYARAGAPIIVLQNGVGAVEDVRTLLGEQRAAQHPIIECTVAFNIIREVHRESGGGVTFHWTSPRRAEEPVFTICSRFGAPALVARQVADVLTGAGLFATAVEEAAMAEASYAKLMMNCGFNAINALSGLGVRQTFTDAGYRKLNVLAMKEARAVLDAKGIAYTQDGIFKYAKLMGLPDPAAVLLVRLLLSERAKSSMWSDLHHGRPTEIEYLNGLVIAMGAECGVPTPLNSQLRDLVREAESKAVGHPRLSAKEIARSLDDTSRSVDEAYSAARRAWWVSGAVLMMVAAFVARLVLGPVGAAALPW
jgi:2-dehydropantoate 2-reductase